MLPFLIDELNLCRLNKSEDKAKHTILVNRIRHIQIVIKALWIGHCLITAALVASVFFPVYFDLILKIVVLANFLVAVLRSWGKARQASVHHDLRKLEQALGEKSAATTQAEDELLAVQDFTAELELAKSTTQAKLDTLLKEHEGFKRRKAALLLSKLGIQCALDDQGLSLSNMCARASERGIVSQSTVQRAKTLKTQVEELKKYCDSCVLKQCESSETCV